MHTKNILRTSVFALAAMFLLTAPASNVLAAEQGKEKESTKIQVDISHWKPTLDANLKVTSNGIGSDIDLKDNLGVSDRNFTDFRITLGNKIRTRVGYTDFNYEGNTNLTAAIDYNGQHYAAGTFVNSKMDMKYYRLGILNRIAGDENNNIDFIVEIKGFQFDTSLKSNYNDSFKKFSGAIPTIGFGASTSLSKKLKLASEITGLTFGSRGHIYDAEANLNYNFTNHSNLAVGYRIFDLKAQGDDNYAQIKLRGPYFKLSHKF